MWRLSQTPCKRTMVERRIGHRIVHNDHLLQQWKRGSGRRHGCSSRFPPVRIQGRGKHAQSPGVLTGVEPGGRGRTLPESRPHAATEMNFGLREKYAEISAYRSSHSSNAENRSSLPPTLPLRAHAGRMPALPGVQIHAGRMPALSGVQIHAGRMPACPGAQRHPGDQTRRRIQACQDEDNRSCLHMR